MAFTITSVKEDPLDGSASREVSGVTYQQTFLVGFTGAFNRVSAIYHGRSDLPSYGSSYSSTAAGDSDGTVYASKIDVRLKPGSVWTGSTQTPGYYNLIATFVPRNTRAFDQHPLVRPPEITGGASDITTVALKDVDGNAYLNSAGTQYENIPEQFIQASDVQIVRNEEYNPFANAATYSHTVNSVALALAAGTVAVENAKLGKIGIQKVYEQWDGAQVTYWRVTYPITLRPDGWRVKPIDAGPCYKDGSGVLQRFKDSSGTELGTGLLNGSGGKLTGSPVVYPTAGFKQYKLTNFYGALNLPDWTV